MADGDSLILGNQSNNATQSTKLVADVGLGSGATFEVANPNGSAAIEGTGFQIGITGNGGNYGVIGNATVEVGGTGVEGTGRQGVVGKGRYVGVRGTDMSEDYLGNGVEGIGKWMGVVGSGNKTGVEGTATDSNGTGVEGKGGRVGVAGSGSHMGTTGISDNGTGVEGKGNLGVTGSGERIGVEGTAKGPKSWPSDERYPFSRFGVKGTAIGPIGEEPYYYKRTKGQIGPRLGVQWVPAGPIGVLGISKWFAGYFQGAVHVDGDFTVSGAKSAAVPHPDGSHRLLYSIESPESWFEDFGTGKLVRGKGRVKLDRQFAAVVHTAGYHVFITPEGDSKGIYVTSKNRAGFEVREQQGGKSSIKFSYRIVAKRKDIRAKRFKKVKLPDDREILKPATKSPSSKLKKRT